MDENKTVFDPYQPGQTIPETAPVPTAPSSEPVSMTVPLTTTDPGSAPQAPGGQFGRVVSQSVLGKGLASGKQAPYDALLGGSMILFCVFTVIGRLAVTIKRVSQPNYFRYVFDDFGYAFGQFIQSFSGFLTMALSLVLPVLIIIFIAKKRPFVKDAVVLFLLFETMNRVKQLFADGYNLLFWLRNHSDYDKPGAVLIRILILYLASVLLIVMPGIPFFSKLRQGKTVELVVPIAFAAGTLLTLSATAAAGGVTVASFLNTFVHMTALFVAVIYALYQKSPFSLLPSSKLFGVSFGSPLFLVIPCVIFAIRGLLEAIISFAVYGGQSYMGYSKQNLSIGISSILLGLISLAVILYIAVYFISKLSKMKKASMANASFPAQINR